MSENFIIEDGFNTSYIDSILMSLFYSPSYLESFVLENDPDELNTIYLQELIKYKFIENIRNGKSILCDSMNEIRNYCFLCGWKTIETLIEKSNVLDFYMFISSKFNLTKIEYQNKKKEIINTDCLQIKLSNTSTSTSTIGEYINIKDAITELFDTTIYKILNIPIVFPIIINRFETMHINRTKINIQKRIRVNPQEEYNDTNWNIFSIICFEGETRESGNYYSIIYKLDKWFLFNNKQIPCLKEIKMNDKVIINKIMEECTMILYLYNKKN